MKLCVALVAAEVLACVAWDVYSSARLRAVREETAKKNLALSMRELTARRPAPPETSNAANFYEAAFSILAVKGISPAKPTLPLVSGISRQADKTPAGADRSVIVDVIRVEEDPHRPMPAYMLADARVYVAERQDIVDLVGRARELAQSQYHEDWSQDTRDRARFTRLRETARLIALAAWVDAEEGRGAEGLSKVRTGLALGRSLEDEPSLWSALNGIAASSVAMSTALPRVLARTEVTDRDLATLQRELELLAETFSVRPAFEGELADICDTYAEVLAGHKPLREWSAPGTVAMSAAVRRQSRSGDSGDARAWAFAALLRLTPRWLTGGYIKADEETAIRYYLHLLDEIDKPTLEYLTRKDPALEKIGDGIYIMSRLLLPAVSRGIEQGEALRARARASAACIAALRYRNETGRWPANLDELVPKYLVRTPADPFSAKPLRYAVLEDGVMIYSVGPNGVDDGGKPVLVRPTEAPARYDDTGFRIWK